MLLVKFIMDWADEFEAFGIEKFKDEEEFGTFLKRWKKKFKPATMEQAKEYFEVETVEDLMKKFNSIKQEFNLTSDENVLLWLADELGLNDVEFYFGTNEFISFQSWEQFLDSLEIIKMDEVQVNLLMGDRTSLGIFPSLWDWED